MAWISPELSIRSPEQLEVARASACSQERLAKWYKEFDQFLKDNSIHDPDQVWNADETGCPLCPKSGRIVAMKGATDVYTISGNSKEQVTTLCAISAAGSVIPPMHVFAGKRFKNDPMKGSVPNAFFGKSKKGWMNTELFHNWLAEHFVKRAPAICPLVLLVDGHSSHIDINTAKVCKKNDILLYCLPPHSSHITQPLDVGFYGPLKSAWKKAVAKYTLDHVGQYVTKYSFAEVFKEAWVNTVKMSTIVNSFRSSGIWPVNPDAIRVSKLSPSTVYHSDEATKQLSSNNLSSSLVEGSALGVLESVLSDATKEKFEKRHVEKCDIETDELYTVWLKLKGLTICDGNSKEKETQYKSESEGEEVIEESEVEGIDENELEGKEIEEEVEMTKEPVSEVFNKLLVLPRVTRKETQRRGNTLLSHLSGTNAIEQMEAKIELKHLAEEEKAKRREEREAKRLQK